MGKNPNAARNKKNYHQEKDTGEDKMEELVNEAARLGCEVWEVAKFKAKEEGKGSDSSSEEEEKPAKFNPKNAKKQQVKKVEVIKEEPMKENKVESEPDSDDAELEKMFGKASDNKNVSTKVEANSSEDEKPKPKAKMAPAAKKGA